MAIKDVRTRRRLALTGSPLQNNLMEYFTMVDFVRKGILGTEARFKHKFEIPISNGLAKDNSQTEVKVRSTITIPRGPMCAPATPTPKNAVHFCSPWKVGTSARG